MRKWIIVVLAVVLAIGVLFYMGNQFKTMERRFEASLTTYDLNYIQDMTKKLEVSVRGDVIVYRNGAVAMVWFHHRADVIPIKSRPLLPGNPDSLYLHSKLEILEIKDVVSKSDFIKWAPLAQRLFELDH